MTRTEGGGGGKRGGGVLSTLSRVGFDLEPGAVLIAPGYEGMRVKTVNTRKGEPSRL